MTGTPFLEALALAAGDRASVDADGVVVLDLTDPDVLDRVAADALALHQAGDS